MSKHTTYDTLDNGTDVIIIYTYINATPPHYGSPTYAGDPGSTAEVELLECKDKASGQYLPLTNAEESRITQWLLENPPEPDYED